MTEPGPIERIPTKVVPYVVTGYAEEVIPAYPDVGPTDEPAQPPRGPRGLVGMAALALAVIMAVLHVIGVVVASGGDFESATVIAWVVIGLSVLAVVGGIVAVILRRGRGWGVAAIALAVIANPVVLLYLLRFVSELQTA